MTKVQEIMRQIEKDGGLTPAKKIREIAERHPGLVAMRDKNFGIWEEINFREYWEHAQWIGCALNYFGIETQDSVAIHSENRPEWFIADIGIQAIGAISVGLYPTNPAKEVEYLIGHSDSKILFAEDQEQVDKVLEVIDKLPELKKIIYFESRGLTNYDSPLLMTWNEFLDTGKEEFQKNPSFVNDKLDLIDPEDIAIMVYTSGTTGPPKGSMITHANLAWVGTNIMNFNIMKNIKTEQQEFVSFLPLCHIFGRLVDLVLGSHLMATINMAESIDTVQDDLIEIQPTFFAAVPRILEKMHAGVLVRMKDASFSKRMLFGLSLKLGTFAAERKLEKGFQNPLSKVIDVITWNLSFRSICKKLGISRVDVAASGAAPISPEVLKFFMCLGVPIFEGYGMTENTGYATGNDYDNIQLGTVGVPNKGCELKLAEDGEILIRHGGVFKGYFKNEEATKETIDEDGWLHTGDVGEMKGRFIKIVDRKKDIIITSGGKNVSPSEIENALKVSPYIKEAIVIGDERKFLAVLIGIEFDTVSNWALRKGITHTTYRDLSEKEQVRELMNKEIIRANEITSTLEIRKFEMIPKELDHEEGELTATQKIKRNVLIEQFSELIESMYK
jgi:long-chain acyl-CoA synthetase